MPKKIKKKRYKKTKKRRKKIKKKSSKNKVILKSSELDIVYKTKKEWIKKATVNKSEYEKKYKSSIKDNENFWKK